MKKGDYVRLVGSLKYKGYVIRVSKSSDWIDVNWGSWSRREKEKDLKLIAECYRCDHCGSLYYN